MDAKEAALKDIDNYLEDIYGRYFRERVIYSKDLDTSENDFLNLILMENTF